MAPEQTILVFFVNGQKILEHHPDPKESLLHYLRSKLHLTGTRDACGGGACGSCTVMVSKVDKDKNIRNMAVNACLTPVCSLHGSAVVTVEGLGSVRSRLHPIQAQLVKAHGTQCGFCTPGFVMSMYTLLRNCPQPTMAQMLGAIKGNLCRCTGYRPIVDAFKPFTKEFQCPMGDDCCRRSQSEGVDDHKGKQITLLEETQEPVFPSELQLTPSLLAEGVTFTVGNCVWIRPRDLQHLLILKAYHPASIIVAGNTTLGSRNRDGCSSLLFVSAIPEMSAVDISDRSVTFGAGVSLATVEDVISLLKTKKGIDFSAFGEMLKGFASVQIKNMATIGGCVASAWTNSDVIPLLLAYKASLTLVSEDGIRTFVLDPTFFLGAEQIALKPHEVILSVSLPFPQKQAVVYFARHAERNEFDTAVVNAALRLTHINEVMEDAEIILGNLAPTTFVAHRASKALNGRRADGLSDKDHVTLLKLLKEDLSDICQDQIGDYDKVNLSGALLRKLLMNVSKDEGGLAAVEEEAMLPAGTQVFEEVPDDQPGDDAVGRPLPHLAAKQHTTGEAVYLDDIPLAETELHLAPVISSVARGEILSLDPGNALGMPGVVDFISHTDVPGSNMTGCVVRDEYVFAENEVTCVGQIIGGILATTRETARAAAKLVKVQYRELKPILTIQDAIESESFLGKSETYSRGDVEAAMATADHVVKGQFELGGQEHFYMETFSARALPIQGDEAIHITISGQVAHDIQSKVSTVLGLPMHKITVDMRRVGGGFGGKESRPQVLIACPLAVAAHKHRRPVRCVFDRDTDMAITGGRHPTLTSYKVGVSKEGKIMALEQDSYANCGSSLDLSGLIMNHFFKLACNCYDVANVKVTVHLCKTNLPSNTAFRGFGMPQAVTTCETWMTQVADVIGVSQRQIREMNFSTTPLIAPFHGLETNRTLDRCWRQVLQSGDYTRRRTDTDEYNRSHGNKKRGMSITTMRQPFHFDAPLMNQGAALVHVYTDGSVLVSHGGVEMGQGLFTKLIQVASRALEIPIEKIHTDSMSTDKTPNAVGTVASCGSDLFGGAVIDACQTLKVRLKPFKEADPEGTWENWVEAAYLERVQLSATGFYKTPVAEPTPGCKYDLRYFTYGAGISEVEVDVLTGAHTVLRTDLVLDVGRSLNPAIDIGQIEGAFLQGYGLHALEEVRYDSQGHPLTASASRYKLPTVGSTPRQFNVSLLKGADNPKAAVYSSKGIGEPALMLGCTVLLAIRDAVRAHRKHDLGLDEYFRLDAPATAKAVRRVCTDLSGPPSQ